jgi:hypothetical protein
MVDLIPLSVDCTIVSVLMLGRVKAAQRLANRHSTSRAISSTTSCVTSRIGLTRHACIRGLTAA